MYFDCCCPIVLLLDPPNPIRPHDGDPQKHISISILKGYPYLIGLHDKGVYMGYPYPNFCLCAFLGPT